MPQLSDLIEKRKFVKKEYRPWDLSGQGTVDHKEKPEEPTQSKTTVTIDNPPVIEPKQEVIVQSILQNTFIQEETGNDSGNTTDNKQVTIKKQRDNIKITAVKQPDNIQVTTREQPDNSIGNITGNAESLPYLIDSVKKLAGIQKNILFYILNVCAARGVLDTGNILSSDLANAANCSIGSAKTSLIRLLEKRLVVRLPGKASRGGHMVLGITREIQSAAIQAQQALYNPLKLSPLDNVTGNVTNNMNTYSSSIYNKNITTTASLPNHWEQIDISPLINIGFSKTQLSQLIEKNTSDIVQESINHFAYALENNPKVKAYSDPLNVLMGVLRKGQVWFEKNYISPKEKALEELLQFKKTEAERIALLEKNILEEEYKIWTQTLSDVDRQQILSAAPKTTMINKGIAEKVNEGHLLQYFKDHIQNKNK